MSKKEKTLRASSRRRWAARCLLLLASLLAALLLAEIALRVWRIWSAGPTTNPYYVVHHDRLGWRYKPGAAARHKTDEFDVAISINAEGFRGPEWEGHNARERILVLGDSLTFGWGVEFEEAFSHQLSGMVGAAVLNLGVSGYGTDQELLLFRERGTLLKPKVVILAYCGNDIEEVQRDFIYGKRKPRFRLAGGKLSIENVPVPYPLLEAHSFFYRFLQRHLFVAAERTLKPEEIAQGRELIRSIVLELARDVREIGAKLLVVASGERWLEESYEGEAPFQYLNVAKPLFRAQKKKGPVKFAVDPHLTPLGHRIVAEEIARCLREKGLIKN